MGREVKGHKLTVQRRHRRSPGLRLDVEVEQLRQALLLQWRLLRSRVIRRGPAAVRLDDVTSIVREPKI